MLSSSKRKTGSAASLAPAGGRPDLPHRVGEVFRRPDRLPYERPRHSDDNPRTGSSRPFASPASVGEFAGSQFDVCSRASSLTARSRARHAETCWIRVVANRKAGAYERPGIKPAPIQENPDVRGSYPDRRGVT